ncbi:TlpA family protein disulfide reductase [Algibacter miyuki]|uniref:TlpA family protein disulfide reductase n=1 Tax=Algibacter miyuki TaxID=1306933 RepID=A0ABV5GXZ6_9FLAO|nr:TlpA family protein disulfide reductase [Algibacter miyuki]MDN3665941.1 TlpA family protein disulfide reductase [Algibacter miyuki]
MKHYLFLAVVFLMVACSNKKKNIEENVKDLAVSENLKEADVQLEVYDFDGFEKFLNIKDDKIHVINFWATWCAPCVKELPYFEKLKAEHEEVDFVLVSLDFPHLYDTKLKPFMRKHKLKSKVIALDDVDSNTWIPKVGETWSGSIPATIIYKNGKRKFYEQSFTYEELEHELKQFLNE